RRITAGHHHAALPGVRTSLRAEPHRNVAGRGIEAIEVGHGGAASPLRRLCHHSPAARKRLAGRRCHAAMAGRRNDLLPVPPARPMSDARALIDRLGLAPHPEGGWYRETWRAPATGGE